MLPNDVRVQKSMDDVLLQNHPFLYYLLIIISFEMFSIRSNSIDSKNNDKLFKLVCLIEHLICYCSFKNEFTRFNVLVLTKHSFISKNIYCNLFYNILIIFIIIK